MPDAGITVVANTGDDMWLHGVRVCPDLDTLMYTLGGAVHEEQGWGRRDESRARQRRPAAYGLGWEWFTLGDLDLAPTWPGPSCCATGCRCRRSRPASPSAGARA